MFGPTKIIVQPVVLWDLYSPAQSAWANSHNRQSEHFSPIKPRMSSYMGYFDGIMFFCCFKGEPNGQPNPY